MIHIAKPVLSTQNGRSRVTAVVDVGDGVSRELWIEVDEKFSDFLCVDRLDAYAVGLVILAIKTRQDITFEAPLTWQLKDGLERDFIDVICQKQPDLYHVRLFAETLPPVEKKKEMVGTGVSCGVDSLFTIKRRMMDEDSSDKILLLGDLLDSYQGKREAFKILEANARSFSKESNIPLVLMRTNYTGGDIPGLCAERCTSYCNMFCALMLQNRLSRYYIASGGPINDFGFYLEKGFFGTDCSDYDLLTLSACSTSSLKFVVDGLELRAEKVAALVEWPLAWNHLDVCFRHSKGMGNGTNDCPKCMHTIVEILCQGGLSKLERFKNVFDVEYVRTHMHEYLADLLRIRMHGDEYGLELWPLRRNAGFRTIDYLLASWIVGKKALKKIMRFGKVRTGYFSSKG